MTIEQFLLLNDGEKEEAVWNDGIFLVNYDEGDDMCDTYELFDFYVAFCYKLHLNEKAKITAHVYPDEMPLLLKLERLFD